MQSGLSGSHESSRAPEVIRIRVTCIEPLSPSTVVVGGFTEGASPGLGTIAPVYSFALEDRGPGNLDKWTIAAQLSGPCIESFGPGAVQTAVRGNIVVRGA